MQRQRRIRSCQKPGCLPPLSVVLIRVFVSIVHAESRAVRISQLLSPATSKEKI